MGCTAMTMETSILFIDIDILDDTSQLHSQGLTVVSVVQVFQRLALRTTCLRVRIVRSLATCWKDNSCDLYSYGHKLWP